MGEFPTGSARSQSRTRRRESCRGFLWGSWCGGVMGERTHRENYTGSEAFSRNRARNSGQAETQESIRNHSHIVSVVISGAACTAAFFPCGVLSRFASVAAWTQRRNANQRIRCVMRGHVPVRIHRRHAASTRGRSSASAFSMASQTSAHFLLLENSGAHPLESSEPRACHNSNHWSHVFMRSHSRNSASQRNSKL